MKWCFFRSALACVLSLNMAMPVIADWSISPVVGGVIGSGEVLKNQVISSLSYSTTLSRDIALFTIAGVTLDAYIVALSLDAKD